MADISGISTGYAKNVWDEHSLLKLKGLSKIRKKGLVFLNKSLLSIGGI